jgi:hypothetical protein
VHAGERKDVQAAGVAEQADQILLHAATVPYEHRLEESGNRVPQLPYAPI